MANDQNSKSDVDTSSRRSIEVHSDYLARLGAEEDFHIVVNHFFHEGEFWQAVIPLKCVAEVFGQAFNFSQPKTKKGANGPEVQYHKNGLPKRRIPILNHVQSRFVLRPDTFVELYPLGTAREEEPAHRINDFVYSIEAIGPVGVRFNFRDGMAGRLLSAHRFLSTHQMVFERIVVENQHVVESPALKLTEPEKQTLLQKSLLRSHVAGTTEPYYLYRCCGTNNCTSSPFQILDKTVNYTFFQWLGSFIYRLPLFPRFYLRIRGLDSDPHVRKFVREEFQDYIRDAGTQKRKREYVRSQLKAIRAQRIATGNAQAESTQAESTPAESTPAESGESA